MQGIAVILLIIGIINNASAQTELADRIISQAFEMDSLRKLLKRESERNEKLGVENSGLRDSLLIAYKELDQLRTFKKQKKEFDIIQEQKRDSILFLKQELSYGEKRKEDDRKNCEQAIKLENLKGKKEILLRIKEYYENKPFDELAISSSKFMIERDLSLLGDSMMVRKLLIDIRKYLFATEVLKFRFDQTLVDSAYVQLLTIQRESRLADALRNKVDNYVLLNKALKETIIKIDDLDNNEKVFGNPEEVQKRKQGKIYVEISSYLFKYDVKIEEYPYLASIIGELMKRKKRNPDSSIKDLIEIL